MFTIFRQYGTIVDVLTYENDISKRTKKSKGRGRGVLPLAKKNGLPRYRPRRADSILRAKKIFLRRVSCASARFGSPLLVTFTFNGSASKVSMAQNALSAFQRRLRVKYHNAISVFVPELSPRGRIHFHGFIFGLPSEWGDKRVYGRTVSVGTDRKYRRIAKLWKVGFVDVRQTDGSPKLASYVSKYITKAGQNLLFDRITLIRITKGFPREWVSNGEHGAWLADKFSEFQESHFWKGENKWLGKMERRVYYTSEKLIRKDVNKLPIDTLPPENIIDVDSLKF